MIYSDLRRYATTHLVVVVGSYPISDRLIMYKGRRVHRKLLRARHFIRNTHILKKVNSVVSTPPSWLAYKLLLLRLLKLRLTPLFCGRGGGRGPFVLVEHDAIQVIAFCLLAIHLEEQICLLHNVHCLRHQHRLHLPEFSSGFLAPLRRIEHLFIGPARWKILLFIDIYIGLR